MPSITLANSSPFNDYGIGPEFRDKARLTEFFMKRRELHPDPLLLTDTIFVSGDHVISEWTQQYTAHRLKGL